ncbi:MAG: hypothetical protein K6T61_08625 [Bryobacteraceae bacterium]|nr:hypothetical protein [Bryobacteraceae bacterium]
MALSRMLARWLKDPPPPYAFELSEAGIAAAYTGKPPRLSFTPLEPDVISVSPVRDNVLRPETLLAQVRALVPADGSRRKRRAALILPDYAVRVTVLDFDNFPSNPSEQLSLIRFRMKRSVPFDVDSAALSYYPQPDGHGGKRVEAVVAISPLEIVTRYEWPFRQAGFQPGWVTTSALAALELLPGVGLHVLVKRTGRILTLAVLSAGVLKLFRAIELAEYTSQEIAGHLYPTAAYIEDQLGAAPESFWLCGFGADTQPLCRWLESELGPRAQSLPAPHGAPGEFDAGLHGYLESLKES